MGISLTLPNRTLDPQLGIPTVAETLAHPAFPTAIWNLEPDRKGLCPVAEGRGGPFGINWEVHGDGPIKLVVRPPFFSLVFGCALMFDREGE